jgi:hypothetical protein
MYIHTFENGGFNIKGALRNPFKDWLDKGCQIFLATTYQNGKIYQITRKYTKWTIYQHRPLQDPPKFTQIWIFGLKIWQPWAG